jgi:hypothetical protein
VVRFNQGGIPMQAETKMKPRIIVKAEIIRADGTKIDLGVISDSKKEADDSGNSSNEGE